MLTILGRFFLALPIFNIKAPVTLKKAILNYIFIFCSSLFFRFSYLRALCVF